MGHRKKHAPRRGSLAFRPHGRARSLVPTIQTWPRIDSKTPTLLGFAGFKAGCTHVITVDEREKTPNFGKPLFNACTVLAAPPIRAIGFRAYKETGNGLQSIGEVYAEDLPGEIERKVRVKPKPLQKALRRMEARLGEASRFTMIAYASPREANLPQKKPFIFEVAVGGGDSNAQFEYLKTALGRSIPVADIVKPGMHLDATAVTKGKGFEGPITRHGVKRKRHKSRKSVRALGVLGAWHPAAVMYTVPRAGQMGFNRRTEYNKKAIAVSNSKDTPITPKGGFPRYGVVEGDYVVLKGSIPGPAKRLVRLRLPLRPPAEKVQPPKILEVAATAK